TVMAAAHHHGLKRIAVQDPVPGALSYKRLLIGANVLARKLSACAPEGEAVGVLLPNANGAAATILGLTSAGRVPALINFTAGAINILAACEAARVKTIVTSRAFIEKGRLEKLVGSLAPRLQLVYLEDVRARVTLSDKLRAAVSYSRPLAASQRSPARWCHWRRSKRWLRNVGQALCRRSSPCPIRARANGLFSLLKGPTRRAPPFRALRNRRVLRT